MKVPGFRYVQGRNYSRTSNGTPIVTRKTGIAVHCTANDASAAGEAAYATRRTDGTSSHSYADRIETIQSLDTDWRAGHAGSSEGNSAAVAIEFTGFNSWSRAKWLAEVNWDAIGKWTAAVCKHHGILIRQVSVAQMMADWHVSGFYTHDQMRKAWGHTDHTDPGPNFPMDHFLGVVNQHMRPSPAPERPAEGGEMDLVSYVGTQSVWAATGGVGYWDLGDKSTGGARLKAYIDAGYQIVRFPDKASIEAIYGPWTATPWQPAPAADVNEEEIVLGVLAGLADQPRKIAELVSAAVPANLARQVVTELGNRLDGES